MEEIADGEYDLLSMETNLCASNYGYFNACQRLPPINKAENYFAEI